MKLLRALAQKDPAALCTELALRGNGIAKLPLPLRRNFWIVSDPKLLDRILVKHARVYDKSGPLYAPISQALGDEGLFTVNDELTWWELRTALNFSFSSHAMPAVNDIAKHLWGARMDEWDTDRPIVLFDEFKRLNIQLLLRYMFGYDAGDVTHLVSLTENVFEGMAGQLMLPVWVPGVKRYHSAINALDRELYQLIEQQKCRGRTGNLLSELLFTTFTENQVRDQLFTLLMAGHDSTASTLAWACIRLGERSGLVGLLRREIQQKLGDQPPTRDTKLPMLTAFWKAVLHQHPAFPLYPRNAVQDDIILDGVRIKAGDQIIVAPHAAHRTSSVWSSDFDTVFARFQTELGKNERAAHFPFGKGRRKCIGETMANTIAIVALSMLLQRFESFSRPDYNSGERIRFAMTAPPKDGAIMRLA